jgi:hypothetical protein
MNKPEPLTPEQIAVFAKLDAPYAEALLNARDAQWVEMLSKQEPVAEIELDAVDLEEEMFDAAVSWCESNGIIVFEPEQLGSLVSTLFVTVRDAAPQQTKPFDLMVITTAYEQGVGKGIKRENSNPYQNDTDAHAAWQIGYEEGESKPAPQQENIQALLKKAAYEEENLAARKTVIALGYKYHGGELWKPPLGSLPQQEPKYKVTVVDDQHPNGVPLAQWCNPQQPNHTEHPLEMVRKPFGYVTPGGEFRKTPEAANAYEWGQKFIAVYTLPQRKPLTTEEILKWYASENGLEDMYMAKLSDFETMVRAVEKKHKIKDASVDHIPDATKMVRHPQINGWIKKSELDQAKKFGGSINLWLERHDCDTRVFIDAAHGIKDNT